MSDDKRRWICLDALVFTSELDLISLILLEWPRGRTHSLVCLTSSHGGFWTEKRRTTETPSKSEKESGE